MSLLLEDSAGNLWFVTADQLTGELITALGPAGTFPPLFLNDPSNGASWEVSITTSGILQTTSVSFSSIYPSAVDLSLTWAMGVTIGGQLQTKPAIAIIPIISSLTRNVVPTGGQIVPLSSSPNQSFTVTLQVDGQPLTLNLFIHWSEMAGYWVMSISDTQDELLLDSIPLITGLYPAGNLLAQYGYLLIGSAYILNEGTTNSDYPGRNDLGSGFVLLWDNTVLIEEEVIG